MPVIRVKRTKERNENCFLFAGDVKIPATDASKHGGPQTCSQTLTLNLSASNMFTDIQSFEKTIPFLSKFKDFVAPSDAQAHSFFKTTKVRDWLNLRRFVGLCFVKDPQLSFSKVKMEYLEGLRSLSKDKFIPESVRELSTKLQRHIKVNLIFGQSNTVRE
jgi:hypothetical protein